MSNLNGLPTLFQKRTLVKKYFGLRLDEKKKNDYRCVPTYGVCPPPRVRVLFVLYTGTRKTLKRSYEKCVICTEKTRGEYSIARRGLDKSLEKRAGRPRARARVTIYPLIIFYRGGYLILPYT